MMIAWQILMGLRSTSRQSAEDNMDRMEVCLLPNIKHIDIARRTWGHILNMGGHLSQLLAGIFFGEVVSQ
jgi:hypothetical protein